jgi:hypothetical protein
VVVDELGEDCDLGLKAIVTGVDVRELGDDELRDVVLL